MNCIAIEIVKKQNCFIQDEKLIVNCEEYLRSNEVYPGMIINNKLPQSLLEHIYCIVVEDCEQETKLDFTNLEIKWRLYPLFSSGGQPDYLQNENDNEALTLSTNWMIPNVDFLGLWENLIYDTEIKQNLLQYVSTMMLFSDKGVDSNVVCSNRVVLLHGPPGTGKTSLCKALAQKLVVKLSHRFSYGQLIEINSHSLFSKWFSESGKLVTKMFSRIYDLVDDPRMLICVLIDEVESLTHARMKCMSGSEPSDSIRVVNAVLTHVDQIKRFSNVLIFTTSNMTAAIDLAFVDRADIKQYIGLPSTYAIYQIYYTCLRELMRAEVIVPSDVLLPASVMRFSNDEEMCSCPNSKELLRICELSAGFSGRTLRKVPFITHALFVKSPTVSLQDFLSSMILAVDYLKKEKTHFENS